MTDQEIICTWMEPPSSINGYKCGNDSPSRWWSRESEWSGKLSWGAWRPRKLTLDALWGVEERLTKMGGWWDTYVWKLTDSILDDQPPSVIHATPEQKTTALAAVLRPIVEAS